MPPRSSWILLVIAYWVHWSSALCNARSALVYRWKFHFTVRVAIYGAGEAGAQLAASLRLAGNHQIITFLDDCKSGGAQLGIPIQPPRF